MISSRGLVVEREGIIVSGHADTGLTGYGEIAPWPGMSPENLGLVADISRILVADLTGKEILPGFPEALEILGLAQKRSTPFMQAPRSSRLGLETMLADLAAQAAGVSIARWLNRDARTTVPVNAFLTGAIDQIEAQIAEKREAGFQTFKLKLLGEDLEEDLERVEKVRGWLGPAAKLRLDANRAYDFDTARELLGRLVDHDIEYVEEPLCTEHLAMLPRLSKGSEIPLALDETVKDDTVWREFVTKRAVEVAVLKPTLVGGLGSILDLVELARSNGVEVVFTTMVESGIGTAACLHLAAAWGSEKYAHGLDTLGLLPQSVINETLEPQEGRFALPAAEGLGVTPDFSSVKLGLVEQFPYDAGEIEKIQRMLQQIRGSRRQERKDRFFLMRSGQAWTYEDFDDIICASARALQQRGIGKGDRVALRCKNSVPMIAALLAMAKLGAVAAPLNLRWRTQNWLDACRQAEVKLLLTDSEFDDRMSTSEIDIVALSELAQRDDGRPFDPPLPPDDPSAPATIVFTSGSSGTPKGVILTHANHYYSALGSNLNIPITPDDCWLLSLPLCHVGGLGIIHRVRAAKGRLYLADDFDVAQTLELIDRGEVTILSLVPTMLQRLLAEWDKETPPRALKAVLLGGAPLTGALRDKVKLSGWPVLTSYGLTETASQVTTLSLGSSKAALSTAGQPLQYRLVKIVSENGREMHAGEVGEIAVGGKVLCQGYLDREMPLTQDGYLLTGDLGSMDRGGYLTVKGRVDDMLISGGENIYPAEIIAAAESFPGVRSAAVIAVDDATWGQRPLLYVEPNESFSLLKLRDHLAANLTRLMRPERIEVVKEMPRTGIGKIDREALRRRYGV